MVGRERRPVCKVRRGDEGAQALVRGSRFEATDRKRRSFALLYPNGWTLFVFLRASHHNRRADDSYRFALEARLSDEEGAPKWWWTSSIDLPGRQRPVRDRRWQRIDPNAEPVVFQSSLQFDVAAMSNSVIGWRELNHETELDALVAELEGWISEWILPAAQSEVEGNSGPPLAGERSL
jgi:hypothetical protein